MAAGGFVGDQNFGSNMVNGNYGSVGAPFNVGQSQQDGGAMFKNGMPQDNSSANYASGGIGTINLPPEMFDEPRNGGFNNGFNNDYASGGIVAFLRGGSVEDEDEEYSGSESDDELAGGFDEGDKYAAYMERQRRERADREAKNKRENAARREASLKGEAQPLRPQTPADGGIGPKLFARAPMAQPDGEGKELVARGQEWGSNLRANAARADAKAKPKKPTEPGWGKVAPSPAAQLFGFLGDINEKNAAYSARENALAREAKGLPPKAPTAAAASKQAAATTAAYGALAEQQAAQRAAAVTGGGVPASGLAAAAQARAPRGVGIPGAGLVAPRAAGVPGVPGAAPVGAPGAPGSSYYGMSTDPKEQLAQLKELAGIDPAAAQELKDYYAKTASPEAMAAQKKQDMWSALAQIGFGMAGSNSPSFLQAAGQSASAAMPGMMQAAKDRRAAEREAMKARYDIQKGENQEKLAMATSARAGALEAGKGLDAKAAQEQNAALEREGISSRERIAILQENGANGRTMMQIAHQDAQKMNLSAGEIAEIGRYAYAEANDAIKNLGPRAKGTDVHAEAAKIFTRITSGFKNQPTTAPPATGKAPPALNSKNYGKVG
jgi:hypothetical protein